MKTYPFYNYSQKDKEQRFYDNFRYRVEVILGETGHLILGDAGITQLTSELTEHVKRYVQNKWHKPIKP